MTLDTVKKYLLYAIGFIIFIMVLGMIGGEKLANSFLVLVIVGAVIINADGIIAKLQTLF